MDYIELIDRNNIPQHIAIIMDGNGRWAQQRGLERTQGHQAGAATVRKLVEHALKLGVRYLTLYTFSTENWNRPIAEVAALMALLFESMSLSALSAIWTNCPRMCASVLMPVWSVPLQTTA